ncbi:FAD binding domain-containing protein [Thermodesulfobacteriota bacterium]
MGVFQECCKLLSEQSGNAQVIAGGTDLLMALKNRLKTPTMLVDLSRISALNQISYSDKEGLKVGAMVTLRHFANHSIVTEKYPFLAQAALAVGDAQLQAMGTIGGNLCQDSCCLYYNRQPMWRQNFDPCHKLGGHVCHAVKASKICWATYCGDLAPALLVLQARIKISGPHKEKIVPLNELYSGDGQKPHILSPDQLVAEIHVPPLIPLSGGTYLKMRVRKTIDYPLLGVAVSLRLNKTDNSFENISAALTGVEKTPILIDGEAPLKGDKTSQEVVENLAEKAFQKAHPINNTYGFSPKYRREMVKIYVKSAVQQSVESAKKQGGAA